MHIFKSKKKQPQKCKYSQNRIKYSRTGKRRGNERDQQKKNFRFLLPPTLVKSERALVIFGEHMG